MKLLSVSLIALGFSFAPVATALAGTPTAPPAHNAEAGAKDIVDGAVASKDHKTLVVAVKAAGLVDTLKGAGPFTVFAPTDAAFGKLPAGTVDTLLEPANKATLTAVLTYHVVAGRVDAKTLIGLIEKGGGKAEVTTVQGGKLTARIVGKDVVLTDAKGGTAKVTAADVMLSNGIIHVVDSVVLPQ